MASVSKGDDRDAARPGLGYSDFHRLPADHLTEAMVTLQQRKGIAVDHHLDRPAEMHLPAADILQISRHTDDAVTVVPVLSD